MRAFLFVACASFVGLTYATASAQADNDVEGALAAARISATAGDVVAQFSLGALLYYGADDTPQAIDWFRKAADHGNSAGQRAVGDFYRKGRSVAVDATEAARWYRLGADRDDVRAQYELGQMYFTRTGVTRDYPSAYVWFSLAALQAPLADNREGLLELRNIAAARMTPEDVAAAARLVAAWKPASTAAK